MKQIGNFIGGMITLYFLGFIVYGIFKEGHTGGIIGIVIIALFIWLSIMRDEKKDKQEKLKQEALNKLKLDEISRIEKIENMSEKEFVSFVRFNHNELEKHFKNGGLIKLGHGVETMRWQTSKYIIESTIEDNDFNKFVDIYRKSDKVKIFSGGWGYGY